jgi:2,4-dichlorophenol 6-monooxygenase
MNATEYDTDVLIVGTGPMGAATALALATYGIRVQAITQYSWLANSPRAHVTNQRGMEVLRSLGVENEISMHAIPWEQIGHMIFAPALNAPEIARLNTWGTGDDRRTDYLLGSPCPILDVIQPLMEETLVTHAARRGAVISLNTEYLSHDQDEHGVTVTLKDRLSGQIYKRRARYLVGADGAHSKVLEDAGLEITGELARAGQIFTRFDADLRHYAEHRPSTIYYIVQPSASFGEIGFGSIRAVRAWDQWMVGYGFDMTKGEPDLSDETALQMIRSLVGDPDLDVDIKWTAPWYVNQAYAPIYSSGRVFCGGDAVHRHPPSSGLGSNTCLQDALNLAWKLAYVVKGHAAPSLLETYTSERAPIGQQIVARANQSRADFAPLRAAIGGVGGAELAMSSTLDGAATRRALGEALELKNFEFNAQGVELNQRYESTAVLPDVNSEPEIWHRDKQLYLQATTRPGAKIPHAWLVDEQGKKISTLDVVGHGQFSLVTGLTGTAWISAAEKLAHPFLRCVVIGEHGQQDLYGTWARLREIDEAGALLIRPDGYVAWRYLGDLFDPDAAVEQLQSALSRLLKADPQSTVEGQAD